MDMVTSPLDCRNSHGGGNERMPDFMRSAPRQMYLDTAGCIVMLGMRYFVVFAVGDESV